MDFNVWLAYVVTAVLFSLAPGSGTVNSISNGINHGIRKSMAAVAGLQIGIITQIVLVGAGLGALIAKSAMAFSILKWIGVAYLIWLGVQKWRDRSSIVASAHQSRLSGWKLMRSAMFLNLSNPKSVVFFVALFPQFIDPSGNQITQFLVLGLTTVVIDTIVMFGYTSLASRLRNIVSSERSMGKLNKIFGSMFVGCGALLATAKS